MTRATEQEGRKHKIKPETTLGGVDLSFAGVPEFKRTKHVHRLHPYLGKFIPQLVELFLKTYFKKGDWILDPFAGSGTTLVEANILGINSVGIEISEFNCLITNVKIREYDLEEVEKEIRDILYKTRKFSRWLREKQTSFGDSGFHKYVSDSEYLLEWLATRSLQEILFYRSQISNYKHQDILKIILSRATRSARLITHYDLARPKKPVYETYWCIKHRRYCEPVQECLKFINRYSWDTIRRLREFAALRTDATMDIMKGDSREVQLESKFDGIFTSPPYVGLIDYHDQHRYAYELFLFEDNGKKEIGSASKGKGYEAKKQYQKDILAVFKELASSLKPEAKIFIVVNDRDNLYADLAEACHFKLQKVYHRPVLKRTERDNVRFSESVYYYKLRA